MRLADELCGVVRAKVGRRLEPTLALTAALTAVDSVSRSRRGLAIGLQT